MVCMKEITFEIPDVCAKPRATQSDRWKKRPVILRYRAFADLARLSAPGEARGLQPDELHIVSYIPMPASWSSKKRAAMNGQPHRQRPDASNLLKAVEDALYPEEDSAIWKVSAEKYWGESAVTIVTVRFHPQP